jgi:hypothetical protein
VINRFGFNNDGAEAIAARLAARPRGVPVGLNLGANKQSADRVGDFARGPAALRGECGLRDRQCLVAQYRATCATCRGRRR